MGNVRQALIWGTIGAAFAVGAVAGATSGHDAAVPGGDTGALWHLLLLWPALAFLVMSAAYLSPRWVGLSLMGKRPDGSIRPASTIFFAPYLALVHLVWLVRHTLVLPRMGENPYDRVAPGLYVGRWCMRYPSEWPEGCGNIVDLTAEFPARASVIRGRRYRCLPSLDCDMPETHAMVALAKEVATWKGDVYVHCANGHGRSASLAAMVMVLRGEADSWREAFRLMRLSRPLVHIQPPQEAILDEVEGELRAHATMLTGVPAHATADRM